MKKILNNPYCLASFMTIISLIIQSRISLYCSGIDGYLISIVSNGYYGKNNYCMFIHPLISYTCGKLSTVLPYADCYSLIIMSFMIFSLFYIYYIIFSQAKVFYKRAVLVLTVICYVFSTCNGLTMRFTLQAGFCMFVGLLLLAMALHNQNRKYMIPGVLCCIFGCMIREQAAFTLVPFFGIVLLYELLSNKNTLKSFSIKSFKYLGIAIFCCITLFLTKKDFFNQTIYSESMNYNTARVSLVDYPIKEWDDIKDKASEYSRNDYYAVTNYIWEDSDIIDSEYLSGISNISNNNFFTQIREINGVQSKINFAATTIFRIICTNLLKTAWFEIGLVILMFSAYLFLMYKDLWVRLALFFNLICYFIILTFFSLLGREVVLKELLMNGSLLVLFYLTFTLNEYSEKVINYKRNILMMVLLVYITLQPFWAQKWFSPIVYSLKVAGNYKLIEQQTVDRIEETVYGIFKGIPFMENNRNSFMDLFFARKSSETTFLLDKTGENEELYIWNIKAYDDELAKLMKENRLPSDELLTHNVAIGEWVSGQVYFKEHLERIGAQNLMKSLLDRPDTFYVGENEQIVFQWLREHYSENIKMEHVKDIESHSVWRYFKIGDSKS